MASNSYNPLDKLASPDHPVADKIAEPLRKFRDDPIVQNPVRKAERVSTATQNVVEGKLDPMVNRRGERSVRVQKIVFAKGIFDVFLSLSLVFFPSLFFDGPIPRALSWVTSLTQPNRYEDSTALYALASLIMGCGFAGISAGESTSDDAYKTVATLNGIFALMSLIGCVLHPHMYGSSFLFLAGLQDVLWFYAIISAGNYEVLETIGFSYKKIRKEADKLAAQAAERYASNGAEGAVKGTVRGVQGEGQRVLSTNPFMPVNATN